MSEAVGVRDDAGRLRQLDAAQIQAIPWEPLRNLDGVFHKVLWRSGDVVIGLVRVEPGRIKPGHVHYNAHHHIWVVSGSGVMVDGQMLAAGSYAYIPPGVEHEVSQVGRDGCTFFYTYRPTAQPVPDADAAVAPV